MFQKNPDESAIRFAAKVLVGKRYEDFETFRLVFRYFLNLCYLYPYVIDICDLFVELVVDVFPEKIDEFKYILKGSIEAMLEEHIPYHRSDVMAWGIYLMIKCNIEFDKWEKISDSVLKTQDVIACLLMFLYLKANNKNTDKFEALLKRVDLKKWWLYEYEVKRILNKPLACAEMEKLRKAKITFLSNFIINRL